MTPVFAGFLPVAESGIKAALTTGMTTDRKIFDFPSRRGIMAEIEYPGIAKLVSRLVWDQETVRSSRTTRTRMNDPTQSEQVDETCRSGRVILCLKSLGITAFLKISCQNGYETLKFKPLQTEVENIKVRRFEHRCLIWRFC